MQEMQGIHFRWEKGGYHGVLMNSYAKGAFYEREFIRLLMQKGAVCAIRGAGSKSFGHGRIDVHAIWKGSLWYFQIKNWERNIPRSVIEDLLSFYDEILRQGYNLDQIKIGLGKRIHGGKWEIYTVPENTIEPEMII